MNRTADIESKQVGGVNYKNHKLRKETLGDSVEMNEFVKEMSNNVSEKGNLDNNLEEKGSQNDLEFQEEEKNNNKGF